MSSRVPLLCSACDHQYYTVILWCRPGCDWIFFLLVFGGLEIDWTNCSLVFCRTEKDTNTGFGGGFSFSPNPYAFCQLSRMIEVARWFFWSFDNWIVICLGVPSTYDSSMVAQSVYLNLYLLRMGRRRLYDVLSDLCGHTSVLSVVVSAICRLFLLQTLHRIEYAFHVTCLTHFYLISNNIIKFSFLLGMGHPDLHAFLRLAVSNQTTFGLPICYSAVVSSQQLALSP